jgi:hypothetical protein
MTERTNVWKLTTIGLLVVGATALVTGLVVANRSGTRAPDAPVAALNEPAASPPATVQTPPPAVVQSPPPAVVQTPPPATQAPRPASPPARVAQTPSQSAIEACNREAASATGGQRDKKGKITEVVKDGAIGAIGGAAVGAIGGAIADGGKGAGKGAIIGGLAGAGGGSLYGIYDNKKHDEKYRNAYSSCMRSRGYTG